MFPSVYEQNIFCLKKDGNDRQTDRQMETRPMLYAFCYGCGHRNDNFHRQTGRYQYQYHSQIDILQAYHETLSYLL